jgi:NAD(P)H-flavin reductase/hemoglobin-like flavoprotein
MPWWRVRSWGRDMDALTRLHKGLLALDTGDGENPQPEPRSAPALLAAPALPGPPAELAPPSQEPVTQDLPTRWDLAADHSPAMADRWAAADSEAASQEGASQEAASQEAASQEAAAGPAGPTQDSPVQTAAPAPDQAEPEPAEPEPAEPEHEEPEPAEPEHEEPEPGQPPEAAGEQKAAEQTAAGPDPAITAIKETFRYVAEAGDKAVGFFYGQLFVRQPRLRQLFPPAMDEQRDRLFHALGRIVESLSTPEEMAAYLSQLGRDHRKYRVEPEMYEAVGAALLATLRVFARDAFTSDAEEAWTAVFVAGSSLMIKAAEEDAGQSPAFWTAEVIQVDHRADDIAVLTIAPDQPLPFTAGQHLTVQTPRWPRVWRSFSIACMPRDDGLLTLHVKAVPGGWVSSALVRHTTPGSELTLGPPLGTMTLAHAADRDLLCVAGGTGLAPVKAIIEQAIRESATTPRRIYLYYGARRRQELYDLPDLWRLEDAYHGFQLIPVTSDDPAFDGMQGNVGRVAARYMPHTDCEAYVAGPAEMVRETIRVLARAGLDKEHIHFDDALLATRPRTGTGT